MDFTATPLKLKLERQSLKVVLMVESLSEFAFRIIFATMKLTD
jgi:hypothetical protein